MLIRAAAKFRFVSLVICILILAAVFGMLSYNQVPGDSLAKAKVSTPVWFRVVDASGISLSNVKVTVFAYSSWGWRVAPVSSLELEIRYDFLTQPDFANTNAEKFRNPGFTASILQCLSNMGFEVHSSDWSVFFKFEYS